MPDSCSLVRSLARRVTHAYALWRTEIIRLAAAAAAAAADRRSRIKSFEARRHHVTSYGGKCLGGNRRSCVCWDYSTTARPTDRPSAFLQQVCHLAGGGGEWSERPRCDGRTDHSNDACTDASWKTAGVRVIYTDEMFGSTWLDAAERVIFTPSVGSVVDNKSKSQ